MMYQKSFNGEYDATTEIVFYDLYCLQVEMLLVGFDMIGHQSSA